MTIPIWLQYLVIDLACGAVFLACLLILLPSLGHFLARVYYEWRWRRRQRRRGGDLIEQLEREQWGRERRYLG